MSAKCFEDLECWNLAAELDSEVYRLFRRPDLTHEYDIKNQMLRSAGSVADNIAEGFERNGNKEFSQFLYISKGSCGELRSQFHRARRRELIEDVIYIEYLAKCRKLSGKIAGLISHVSSSDFKGSKFM
jgi:four helix bundle protein